MKPLLVLPTRPGIYRLTTVAGSTYNLNLITDTLVTVMPDGKRSEPSALRTVTNAVVGECAYLTADDPHRRSGGVWHLTAAIISIEELAE